MLLALWKQAGVGAEAGEGAGAGMTRTTQEAGALVTGLLAVVQVNPSFPVQATAGRFAGACTCLTDLAVSAIAAVLSCLHRSPARTLLSRAASRQPCNQQPHQAGWTAHWFRPGKKTFDRLDTRPIVITGRGRGGRYEGSVRGGGRSQGRGNQYQGQDRNSQPPVAPPPGLRQGTLLHF